MWTLILLAREFTQNYTFPKPLGLTRGQVLYWTQRPNIEKGGAEEKGRGGGGDHEQLGAWEMLY